MRAATAAVDVGRDAAQQGITAATAQLLFDVTQAYYDAALSERLVAIAQATLDQAGATLSQTQAGFEAGTQPEFEVVRARVARDNQLPALIRQRVARDVALLRLKQLLELLTQLIGDSEREPFDLQHHARQGLPDFVMQLARHALALSLLHQQRLASAFAPFGLEAIEHVIERARQRRHVRVTRDLGSHAGCERVLAAHRLGQLVERRERRPQPLQKRMPVL